jgi:hypothetical protein
MGNTSGDESRNDPMKYRNSPTKIPFWLSKRLAEVGITIRKNGSTLSFSSNPIKKVISK